MIANKSECIKSNNNIILVKEFCKTENICFFDISVKTNKNIHLLKQYIISIYVYYSSPN